MEPGENGECAQVGKYGSSRVQICIQGIILPANANAAVFGAGRHFRETKAACDQALAS